MARVKFVLTADVWTDVGVTPGVVELRKLGGSSAGDALLINNSQTLDTARRIENTALNLGKQWVSSGDVLTVSVFAEGPGWEIIADF